MKDSYYTNINTNYQSPKMTDKNKNKNNIHVSKSIPSKTKYTLTNNTKQSSSRRDRRNINKVNKENSPSNKKDFLQERQERENAKLKKQIALLENKINLLKEEIDMYYLSRCDDNYLNNELQSAQRRADWLGLRYMKEINDLKYKMHSNRVDFQTEINNSKKVCMKVIESIKDNCENVLNKQQFLIELYMEKNKEMKEKLEKMKILFKPKNKII